MMEDNENLPNRRTKKFCTLSCETRPFSTSLSNNLREFIQKASVAKTCQYIQTNSLYDQYVT